MNRILTITMFLLSIPVYAGGSTGNQQASAETSITSGTDLIGSVTNSNRIRDDVNDYILTTFANDPKKQLAATRFAQSNQRILEVIAENRPVTQNIVTKISYAGLCLAQNMDKKSFMKHTREITARTFNTEARFRAHDEFSQKAYGMPVATSDHVDACEAAK